MCKVLLNTLLPVSICIRKVGLIISKFSIFLAIKIMFCVHERCERL
jgi:hypothetical protein